MEIKRNLSSVMNTDNPAETLEVKCNIFLAISEWRIFLLLKISVTIAATTIRKISPVKYKNSMTLTSILCYDGLKYN